ncbi:GAF and ANTAR domain-containing protein [Mycobacterium sp. URHB0021]
MTGFQGPPSADDAGDITARIDEAISAELRTTRRQGHGDVYSILSTITALAVDLIPPVHHAGITLIEASGVIRSLGATDGHPLVLDNLQRRFLEGPCYHSAHDQRPYAVPDLEREPRWSMFIEKALRSTPVRSILAIPLSDDDTAHAALNLYADKANAFDESATAMGLVFGRQLTRVMRSPSGRKIVRGSAHRSDVVGQAKQRLMHRFDLDVAQAVSVLVQLSTEQHDSLEAVARLLLAGDQRDMAILDYDADRQRGYPADGGGSSSRGSACLR